MALTSSLELQVARNCEKNQHDEYQNQCIHGGDLLPGIHEYTQDR
jgi:hypothetical protein